MAVIRRGHIALQLVHYRSSRMQRWNLGYPRLNIGDAGQIPKVHYSKVYLSQNMGEQHAMANLPAIAEGVAAEEQILMAEASSVSRNADLQKLRQDKREFIKVSRLLLVSATPGLACCAMEAKAWSCSRINRPIQVCPSTCRQTGEPLPTAQSLGRLSARFKAQICRHSSEPS